MSKVIAYEPPLPITLGGISYTIQASLWLRFTHKRHSKPYHAFHRCPRSTHSGT